MNAEFRTSVSSAFVGRKNGALTCPKSSCSSSFSASVMFRTFGSFPFLARISSRLFKSSNCFCGSKDKVAMPGPSCAGIDAIKSLFCCSHGSVFFASISSAASSIMSSSSSASSSKSIWSFTSDPFSNDKLPSSSANAVIFGASSSTVPPILSTTSSKPSSVERSDRLFQRKTPLLPACVVARYSSVGESAKLVILSDPIFIVCNKRAEGMSKTLSMPRVSQEITHSRSEVISTFVAKTSFFFFFFFLLPSTSFSSPPSWLLFSLFKRNVRTRFLVPISNNRIVPSCKATANNSAVLCK